jgi:hypothetical protein
MFKLLQHAFVTQSHLSLEMDAVAIWLARPQRMTLESLDAFLDVTLGKNDQQQLRTELIATMAYLTRSAQRL